MTCCSEQMLRHKIILVENTTKKGDAGRRQTTVPVSALLFSNKGC